MHVTNATVLDPKMCHFRANNAKMYINKHDFMAECSVFLFIYYILANYLVQYSRYMTLAVKLTYFGMFSVNMWIIPNLSNIVHISNKLT